MSIPERLWRVARGHWTLASDRIADLEAQASAYEELADAIRAPAPPPGVPSPGAALPPPSGTAGAAKVSQSAQGQHDPLEASYALLGVEPGAQLTAVSEAYEAKMDEIRPEAHPAGSPERAALEARRSAVQAAYDRIRDLLNPTETRFERLEF